MSKKIWLLPAGLAAMCAVLLTAPASARQPATGQPKPIACAFEQLSQAQRETVAVTMFRTNDTAKMAAVKRVVLNAVERCPGFARMKDGQPTLAADYAEGASAVGLIENELAALGAPPGLVDRVWAGLSETQRKIMLQFATSDVEPPAEEGPKVLAVMVAAGVKEAWYEPVGVGLIGKALMLSTESQW